MLLGDRLPGLQHPAKSRLHAVGLGPWEEFTQAPPECILPRDAMDLLERVVDPEEAQLGVVNREADRCLLEQPAHYGPVGVPATHLCRPDEDREPVAAAFGDDRPGPYQKIHVAPVAVPGGQLTAYALAGPAAAYCSGCPGAVRAGRQQLDRRQPDHRVRVVPEQFRCRAAPGRDHAAAVHGRRAGEPVREVRRMVLHPDSLHSRSRFPQPRPVRRGHAARRGRETPWPVRGIRHVSRP